MSFQDLRCIFCLVCMIFSLSIIHFSNCMQAFFVSTYDMKGIAIIFHLTSSQSFEVKIHAYWSKSSECDIHWFMQMQKCKFHERTFLCGSSVCRRQHREKDVVKKNVFTKLLYLCLIYHCCIKKLFSLFLQEVLFCWSFILQYIQYLLTEISCLVALFVQETLLFYL